MGFGKRHPTGQSFLERRSGSRHQKQATGEILVPGKPPQQCVITEFSDTGASLQLSSLFGIANTFELRAFGQIHTARVIRKAPRRLFVTFDSNSLCAYFSPCYPAA